MAYGESISHVTGDVTWLRKVKVVTPICLGPNISKGLEIEAPLTFVLLFSMCVTTQDRC